jgi:hypothetical protein
MENEQIGVALSLWVYTGKIVGLNLGQNTGYPEVFHGSPQSLDGTAWIVH